MPISKKKKERNDDKRKEKKEEKIIEGDEFSDVADLEPIEVHCVPDDQIKGLSEEQLKEEFTKALVANNPKAHKNLANFNFKEGAFEPETESIQVAVHFTMNETLIHVTSEEAKKQGVVPPDEEVISAAPAVPIVDTEEAANGKSEEDAAANEATDENSAASPTGGQAKEQKALKNQFNFSERASQTFNNPMRDRMVATEPPPTRTFTANINPWVIFDAYLAALKSQKEAKQLKDAQQQAPKTGKRDNESEGVDVDLIIAEPDDDDDRMERMMKSEKMYNSVKLMERIVNLNSEDEVYNDFKYYNEETDTTRGTENGYFLPLWRFSYGKAKKKTVTALCWNSQYPDLFAVSFGSYDFMKQQSGGLICCYSLKNTTHPEYVFSTTTGVMCIDFHPQHAVLLAAGMYDGSVAVYDVRSSNNLPIYQTSDPKVKHTDPVWQVRWQEDDHAKDVSFYSISSDGIINQWTMSKNELKNEEVMPLKLVPKGEDEIDDDAALIGLAGGVAFDFNRQTDHMFIVGTDEGSLHKCSKAYNSQYLETYKGHHMAVYSVKWNPFHKGVFISCSADWTLRIWEHNTVDPLMTFDLGTSVSDVAWAPYSSTVFSAVTSDGKVYLFDLNVNKHEAISQQRIVKKGKLTHVAFNRTEPILLVGDDRGSIMSLKLSPNLRKLSAKTLKDLDQSYEIDKLEKVLLISTRGDERQA